MGENLDIQRMFADHAAQEKDYYRRTRIFPIMHLVVLRRDIYEQHPFVATSLYRAFAAPRTGAAKDALPGTLRYMLPWMGSEI